MHEWASRSAIMLSVLIVAPMLCSLLLKWARCPSWPIAGGLLAGLLWGPTIFGRIAPDEFARVFAGAQTQRRAVEQLIRRHQADELAAERGLSDVQAQRDLRQRHAEERAMAERDLHAARWEAQRPLRILACVIVALTLLASAPFDVRRGEVGQSAASTLSIGSWAAAVPGALAFAAMISFWGSTEWEAALVAAALAIGPWALAQGDREAADSAEIGGARLIQSAGRVASIIALVVAAGALWMSLNVTGLALAAPLAALPAAWFLPKIIPAQVAKSAVDHMLLPALTATALIKVDWIDDFSIWPLLIILLLSDDGRWIGAFIGAMLPGGRRGLRTMRLVVGSMAAGPTQLAVTAIGAHAGLIAPRFILPLVLGTALIELMAPVRHTFAQRVSRAEEELESPDEGKQ